MEHPSAHHNAVVAVFTRHQDAEEKVVGFYNMGDRIKFWGKNGAFWVASGACSLAASS